MLLTSTRVSGYQNILGDFFFFVVTFFPQFETNSLFKLKHCPTTIGVPEGPKGTCPSKYWICIEAKLYFDR